MATMKSNNAAIAAMQQMLQERCIAEPTFAIKMANPLITSTRTRLRTAKKSTAISWYQSRNSPMRTRLNSRSRQWSKLRRQSQPKAQPKPTATAPKAGEEINVQPSLFDF